MILNTLVLPLWSNLWAEAADIVSWLSQEVLGRTVTAEDNHRLMQDAIGQIKRQPDGNRRT